MTPITTRRLILRPFTEADLPEFMAIQRDPVVNRFLPWFVPKTMTEARQLLHDQYLITTTGYHLAICQRMTNKAIGYLNIDADESHDLGYGLNRDFWGHGYMTEACQALIAQLAITDYPYLTATHDVQNPKSGAVMQRLGMVYQYTYLEQWQPKNYPVHFRLYLLNRDGNVQRQYLKYWERSSVRFVEDLM